MLWSEILIIAFRALRSNKMRSGLTLLGLVIGVAAVILLTAFGQGVGNSATAAIEPVANSITVIEKLSPIPGGPDAQPLTDADEQAIAQLPNVAQLVPEVTGATTGSAGQQAVAVTASTPTRHYTSASVLGTTSNYLAAYQRTVIAGTFFSQEQEQGKAKVAVIGPLIDHVKHRPPHAGTEPARPPLHPPLQFR